MISDNIKNAKRYENVNNELIGVFHFMEKLDKNTPDGKYILSENAYVNVSTCETQPFEERANEVHNVYADVQYMISGCERIDICPSEGLEITKDMFADKDAALLTDGEYNDSVVITDGEFVLIYPGEAHKPLISPDGNRTTVKKAIGKVRF